MCEVGVKQLIVNVWIDIDVQTAIGFRCLATRKNTPKNEKDDKHLEGKEKSES